MFFSVLCPRAGRFSAPLDTKQTMSFSYNHGLNLDIFLTYFFKLFETITLNFLTVWLHSYGSSKTFVDQGEWSIYLVHDKICEINFFTIDYVAFWLSNTLLKCLHGFCYFLLFVFLPCWLVGFWIFKWRKTDRNITMALQRQNDK
jgi:hypothetical protein